jgi:predicted nucleic acid-binding protein
MYLFDTNIVAELRRTKPHGAVLDWVAGVPDEQIYLSAVSLGEIQKGIEALRPRDAQKAESLEAWADLLTAQANILPMTGAVFRLWAKLMHGKSDTAYEDAMLAATAITHRLTLVTRNIRDFQAFGISLLNPFEPIAGKQKLP